MPHRIDPERGDRQNGEDDDSPVPAPESDDERSCDRETEKSRDQRHQHRDRPVGSDVHPGHRHGQHHRRHCDLEKEGQDQQDQVARDNHRSAPQRQDVVENIRPLHSPDLKQHEHQHNKEKGKKRDRDREGLSPLAQHPEQKTGNDPKECHEPPEEENPAQMIQVDPQHGSEFTHLSALS